MGIVLLGEESRNRDKRNMKCNGDDRQSSPGAA